LLSLADAWRITWLMAGSALLASVANVLLLLEPGAAVAIALRMLTGVALAGIYPPALKFIATWFRHGRGLAMGTMVGALTLGSALPHLLQSASGSLDWTVVILASSLACLAAALIFGLALREGPYPFARTSVDLGQLGRILRNRPVMLANIGYFGHMWELYAMWGWFLAFALAAEADGLALGNASLLTFAVLAMGAPGCILAGWLADRIGRCNTTALMMAISGTAALLIGLVFNGPLWLFALVALIWGLTVVADSAQFSAAVTELADQSLIGSALAFQMGVGFATTIFVIWLMPHVVAALGSWQWSFAILIPGPVVGIIAMLQLRSRPEATKMANGFR
jgi:MFS family permease